MIDRAVPAMMSWITDAAAFAREALGVKLDPWQERALRIISRPEPLIRLALVACKGPGKSFVLACAGAWWFFTRRRAQVICTSITSTNLRDGLWKEILAIFGRSPVLQRVAEARSDRIIMLESPADWFISARAWAKDADPSAQESTLAGLHGPAMMYLGDEVGDYSPGVIPAAEAMGANAGRIDDLTGEVMEARFVVAGNPTDSAGPLYGISKDSTRWEKIHVTSDPEDPERTSRVPVERAQDLIDKHGRDHPYVRVNVLGLFPLTAMTTLLGPDEVGTSMRRRLAEVDYHWSEKRIGVDVARYGLDSTIISLRQGVKLGPFVEMRGGDCQEVAARVALAWSRSRAQVVVIDADGVGGGVVDACRVAGLPIVAVHSAGKPIDPRYYNRRAEMNFRLAEWVKDRGVVPAGYPRLEEDLTAARYSTLKGRLIIEEKDQIKKRLGRSPDWSDAAALTFAIPDAPALSLHESLARLRGVTSSGGRARDYDPIGLERGTDGGDRAGSGSDFDPFRNF